MNRKWRLALPLTIAAALVSFAGSALAQTEIRVVTPDKLSWEPNPVMPEGAQRTILLGEPTKAGSVVVLRIKMPANYLEPPHTNPGAHTVTLISGSLGFGTGGKVERMGELFKPGTLFAIPANFAYYLWTGDDEAVIQVQFIGPFGIDYINPADDPRKK
jgi:quercetin dioxygenase-like cupin family protein